MMSRYGEYDGDEEEEEEKYEDEDTTDSTIRKEDSSEYRLQRLLQNEVIDAKFGFVKFQEPGTKLGWLLNFQSGDLVDKDRGVISCVDYFFIQEDGVRFKVSQHHKAYMYIGVLSGCEDDLVLFVSKKYNDVISGVEVVAKEDLDLANHLVGIKRKLLKISFHSVENLIKVRKEFVPFIRRNKDKKYHNSKRSSHPLDNIVELREHDVPYHLRVAIDNRIMAGKWYDVTVDQNKQTSIVARSDVVGNPDPVILAFDLETTKLPLKFPDPSFDQIFLISYMVDGQGYLISNREVMSEDVSDFEYTPRSEFPGPFTVSNQPDELCVIRKFIEHILQLKPNVFVTYNGDFFDWTFLEERCKHYNIDMAREVGMKKQPGLGYLSRVSVNMDCFLWVKRDSYLPVGSHNLKAVTKAKLRYDPVEVDPEDMVSLASEDPQTMANYSVSDAVSTYYLYLKFIHPFIFALSTIIPLQPDQVLRKGSGTLCESLLMVEAFHGNIIFPNKQESVLNRLTEDGHVIDTETYVGGYVEALESGVFRCDLPSKFKLCPDELDRLVSLVDNTLTHAIQEEEKVDIHDVTNLDEVKEDIVKRLLDLKSTPIINECPIIYHLDVAAMYPNIILTNRLQPSSIITEVDCGSCDFNRMNATCLRKMGWSYRVDYLPPSRSEYQRIQQQLENETFPPLHANQPIRAFHQLPIEEQKDVEKKRLADYSRKAYKKTKVTRQEEREALVCQRENSFYVDTVRSFRDRRYEFKNLTKVWKKKLAEAEKDGQSSEMKRANDMIVLYDSLQLAHKCILNSFYGYVMRRGARWYSMEMAGVVCYTGGQIIRKAREIIDKIGRPLELDTDGIWCMLPRNFPENYVIKTAKKSFSISYPGALLNIMVKDHFTNDQYHELVDKSKLKYEIKKENSIFFEVDGPYKAMVLPASKEEGKKLKKRYAVFNMDGSLAELKGFEIKRRGELKLIKIFQSSVFEAFLGGNSLEECYKSVASVASYWLDVLFTKAAGLPDKELFELVCENRSMSRRLQDYEGQKSTSISTAKRLAEFLGDEMVKDAGLACKYIISKKPEGSPVAERAIPVAIFQAEEAIRRHYLNRWLKSSSGIQHDIRSILDWEYYIERLASAIQKIITIPAALQGVQNPVPRIPHPDWLHKRLLEKNDVFKQKKIIEMFQKTEKKLPDIEDIISTNHIPSHNSQIAKNKRKRNEADNLGLSWRQILGKPPPMGESREDLVAWLQFHKKKWSHQLKQKTANSRKRMKLQDDYTSRGLVRAGLSNEDGSSIGGFLRKTARALLDWPWQIIQVSETSQPGLFKLWALIGQDLHCLNLNVPRIFYVNLRTSKTGDSAVWTKVNRLLPRGHRVHHLYRYSVAEETYMQHMNEITTDLSSPDVEGVYETQVPLIFRVLMDVGCVAMVTRDCAYKLRNKETDTFDLENLTFKTLAQCSYLEGNIKHVYLYHRALGTKQMHGLFIPATKRAHILVIDTVRTNQMPNLSAMFQQERNKMLKERGQDEIPEEGYTFDIRIETDVMKGRRALNRVLGAYKEERRGPTFVVLQTTDLTLLTSSMTSLNDFPVVRLPLNEDELLYQVIDWQKVGSKDILNHFMNIKLILNATLEQCRYLHIPLGNLPDDITTFACDLFFSRHLKRHSHVLWCSVGEKPDLGGKEVEDGSQPSTDFTVINTSGCYSTVCVEVQIISLPVNALLQSNKILEGEGLSTQGFNNNSDILPTTSSHLSSAFRVLKNMVYLWLSDVSNNNNVFADHQILHMYRWLKSPTSLLYDPVLSATLHNLVSKLFNQLVHDIRRLGCTIVYADPNRIIINTRKYDVTDAVAYVDYVIGWVKSRELYEVCHISYLHHWEVLLWADAADYGGVRGALPSTNNDNNDDDDIDKDNDSMVDVNNSQEWENLNKNNNKNKHKNNDDDVGLFEDSGDEKKDESNEKEDKYEEENSLLIKDINDNDVSNDNDNDDTNANGGNNEDNSVNDDAPEVEMNWNLCKFLPEGVCQNDFNLVIGKYILSIHNHLRHSPTSNTPIPLSMATSTRNSKDTTSFCRNFIKQQITHLLFGITQKLLRRHQRHQMADFPNLPGSHLFLSHAPLQFVKSVCHVLMLDSSTREEVEGLKRDLLRMVGVGEFSEDAVFVHPCLTYVVSELFCKHCNSIRDVDLCKDSHVNSSGVWCCKECNNEYDVTEVERMLCEAFRDLLMVCTLQDLKCSRCKQICATNMSLRCDCSGSWTTLQQSSLQKLRTLAALSDFYKMEQLQESLSWFKKCSPGVL